MSETINILNFDFYLDFKSDSLGLVQIDEPLGIDSINLVTESDDGRYARDVFFGGNDKVKLTFTSERGSKDLGFYFDKFVEYDNVYGFESEIDFIIKNRVTDTNYIVGSLEFEAKETDHYSFFKCNIIQVKNQALLKRLEDVKVDVFSAEDLDGNEITPVSTSNILIPAKPIIQNSEWYAPDITVTFQDPFFEGDLYWNGFYGVTKSEIKNTLSFLSDVKESNGDNFVFINAVDDLTDVKIVGEDINFTIVSDLDEVRIYYRVGVSYASATEVQVVNLGGGFADGFVHTYTDVNYEFDVVIPSSNKLWIYYKVDSVPILLSYTYHSGKQYATATKTGLDTVTKGVRLLDATKQVSSSVNQDFNVIAPRLESQGEHYNQFIFSGDMIRGRENPFNIEWKDMSDYLISENNLDYQVIGDTLYVGKEDDFYTNIEIGSFLQAPDSEFNIGYNERFSINEVSTKFKSFNQDKDDENTIDGVHTEMELVNANRSVQNTKDIECDFIRDPFLLATTQDKAASETSTSLSQDDKIFITDCITVAPSQTRSFQRRLTHNVNNDGNLELLGSGFNWTILGFVIGDIFTIDTTSNAGDYTVLEITNNIVTLTPIASFPASIGSKITQVTYPLTDVQYILRTNEGFDIITGIESPTQYANLLYTLKRSLLNNYGAYLKTSTLYKPEDIKVTFLKNNVDLTTQFDGGEVINELEPITQDQLPNPILTPRLITAKVLCTFEEYTDFKTKLETINDTETYIKTIGGFIRIIDNHNRVLKAYPRNSDFTWADGSMDLELEEKWESPITNITLDSGLYFINEVGYDLDGVTIIDYNVTDTDYIQFFDSNTRPLTNVMKYNLVSVNNIVYDSMSELIGAINSL